MAYSDNLHKNEIHTNKVCLSSLPERIINLNDALKETQEAIQSRKDLSKKFREQIEKEIKNTLTYLETLQPPWKLGFELQYEFLRTSIHKSLTSRRKELRSEELRLWEDVTGLMREKRKVLMELQSLRNSRRRLSE